MTQVSAEELDDLADAVRGLLHSEDTAAGARRAADDATAGHDARVWSLLCEQIGVAGLGVPERFGGTGAGVRALQVVAERLGRVLAPVPFLGSAVLAVGALVESGDEEACARLLPDLAGGAVGALAWCGPGGGWTPETVACRAASEAGHDQVTGAAHYVLGGHAADTLLVLAWEGTEVGLFEVAPHGPGVAVTRGVPLDPTRPLATIRFSGAPARRIGTGDYRTALGRIRDLACTVLAAEEVGTAARALELTVDYTKNRMQFGRPVGGFQALKHRMADMHVLVETARSASWAAGEAFDAGDDTARAAAVARVYCTEALGEVAGEMIQMHGGIAITWEHDAHLFFKRAHGGAQLLGQPHEHLSRLAAMVLPGP